MVLWRYIAASKYELLGQGTLLEVAYEQIKCWFYGKRIENGKNSYCVAKFSISKTFPDKRNRSKKCVHILLVTEL